MGVKYPTNLISGFDSNPPPDDGTTGDDNKVTWAKHKDKLAIPVKALAEAINTDIVAWADNAPVSKAVDYPTVADDNGRMIQGTGTTTITLGAAASMGSGYEVSVKNAGAAVITVATTETIDGGGSRTLNVGEIETYVVSQSGTSYLIKGNKGIGTAETATLTNKTLTAPVINAVELNGAITGDALNADLNAAAAADEVVSAEEVKDYVDTEVLFSRLVYRTTEVSIASDLTEQNLVSITVAADATLDTDGSTYIRPIRVKASGIIENNGVIATANTWSLKFKVGGTTIHTSSRSVDNNTDELWTFEATIVPVDQNNQRVVSTFVIGGTTAGAAAAQTLEGTYHQTLAHDLSGTLAILLTTDQLLNSDAANISTCFGATAEIV